VGDNKEAIRAHILRRHFELIFAERVQPTECDVWMGDTVLSGRKQLELIPRLQNRTVVRGDVQTEHDPSSRIISAGSSRDNNEREDIQQRNDVVLCRGTRRADVRGHPDFEATPENRARDVVLDQLRKMRLVDDREHVVAASDPIRDKARIFKHEYLILRI
jgi:hypothetical protein